MNGIVQKAIDKLLAELNKKQASITKEDLLQNGLEVKRINGVAKSYDIVVTSAASQYEKSDGYPVAMIDSMNNSIEKININAILEMVGIDYALIAAWDEENKLNWEEWLKEADTVVPDSASTQHGMDKYNLEFLESYFKRTRNNKQGFRMNSVFWNAEDVAKNIRGETDPTKVETFMRERLATLIKLRPTEMNIVLEPFDFIEGKFLWARTPWYNAFGEDWIVRAFQFAKDEAEKQGLTLGKDIKFYWNDWQLDKPSTKLDFTLAIVDKIIQAGAHIDGIGIQITPKENNRYYPHEPNKDELIDVMRTISKHTRHVYVEYGTWRLTKEIPSIISIGTAIFEACKVINYEQPKTVTSFGIWDNYDPASSLDSYIFYRKVTYEPNMNYYDLEKEMIRILAQ